MIKLSIDTGVQEFEINGGEAAGGGILRFNPSDPNVYNRFFEARERLIELDREINERQQALREETLSDEEKAGRLPEGAAGVRYQDQSIAGGGVWPGKRFRPYAGRGEPGSGRYQW